MEINKWSPISLLQNANDKTSPVEDAVLRQTISFKISTMELTAFIISIIILIILINTIIIVIICYYFFLLIQYKSVL